MPVLPVFLSLSFAGLFNAYLAGIVALYKLPTISSAQDETSKREEIPRCIDTALVHVLRPFDAGIDRCCL
jgi:hypothetical protein